MTERTQHFFSLSLSRETLPKYHTEKGREQQARFASEDNGTYSGCRNVCFPLMQKRMLCQRMSLEGVDVFFLLLFKSNAFNVSNWAVSRNL